MNAAYWVTFALSAASLAACVRLLGRSAAQHRKMRYTSTDMRTAYLRGFEDAVFKRRPDSVRALSEREIRPEASE